MERGSPPASRDARTPDGPPARLILDTTVLIDAERDARSLQQVVADDDDVAIAAITAAELLVGVELASDRRRESRESFAREIFGVELAGPG